MKNGNRFFNVALSIIKNEINPSNTVSFFSEVDLTQVEQIRARAKSLGKRKPTYTAFVVKALSRAVKSHQISNRRVCRKLPLPFLKSRIQEFKGFDIAVQAEVDLPETEIITFIDIIREADRKSLTEINNWIYKLAHCTLENNEQLKQFDSLIKRLPQWLSKLLIQLPSFSPKAWIKHRGGAFLVNSPAKYGVDVLASNWPWPVTISFGLVKERPVVRNGQVVPCPTFTLIMNFDRRVMAGAPAARFFSSIVNVLVHADEEIATPIKGTLSAPEQLRNDQRFPAQPINA